MPVTPSDGVALQPLTVPAPARWDDTSLLGSLPLAAPAPEVRSPRAPAGTAGPHRDHQPPEVGSGGVQSSQRRGDALRSPVQPIVNCPHTVTASSVRPYFFQTYVGARVRLDPAVCDDEWLWIDTLGLETLVIVGQLAKQQVMGTVIRESGDMAAVVEFRVRSFPQQPRESPSERMPRVSDTQAFLTTDEKHACPNHSMSLDASSNYWSPQQPSATSRGSPAVEVSTLLHTDRPATPRSPPISGTSTLTTAAPSSGSRLPYESPIGLVRLLTQHVSPNTVVLSVPHPRDCCVASVEGPPPSSPPSPTDDGGILWPVDLDACQPSDSSRTGAPHPWKSVLPSAADALSPRRVTQWTDPAAAVTVAFTLPTRCFISVLQDALMHCCGERYYGALETHLGGGDYGSALVILDEILTGVEDQTAYELAEPVRVFRSRLLFHMGEVEESLRAAIEVIQEAPVLVEPYTTALAALLTLGRVSEARAVAIQCQSYCRHVSPAYVKVARLLQVIEASCEWRRTLKSHRVPAADGGKDFHVEVLPAETPGQTVCFARSFASPPAHCLSDLNWGTFLRRLAVLQHSMVLLKNPLYLHAIISQPLVEAARRAPSKSPETSLATDSEARSPHPHGGAVPFPEFIMPHSNPSPVVRTPLSLQGPFGAAPMIYTSRQLRLHATRAMAIGDVIVEEPPSICFPMFPSQPAVKRRPRATSLDASAVCGYCGLYDPDTRLRGMRCAAECGEWYCTTGCCRNAFLEFHCVSCTGVPPSQSDTQVTPDSTDLVGAVSAIRSAFATMTAFAEQLWKDYGNSSSLATTSFEGIDHGPLWQPCVDAIAVRVLGRVVARVLACYAHSAYAFLQDRHFAFLSNAPTPRASPAAPRPGKQGELSLAEMSASIANTLWTKGVRSPRTPIDPQGMLVAEEVMQHIGIPFFSDANLASPITVWEAQKKLPPSLAEQHQYPAVVAQVFQFMQIVHGVVQRSFAKLSPLAESGTEAAEGPHTWSVAIVLGFMGSVRFADQLWDLCRTAFIVVGAPLNPNAPKNEAIQSGRSLPLIVLAPFCSAVTDLLELAAHQEPYSRFCLEYSLTKDFHAVVHGADASSSFLSLNSMTGSSLSSFDKACSRSGVSPVAALEALVNTSTSAVTSNAVATMEASGMIAVTASCPISPGAVVCSGSRPLLEWVAAVARSPPQSSTGGIPFCDTT